MHCLDWCFKYSLAVVFGLLDVFCLLMFKSFVWCCFLYITSTIYQRFEFDEFPCRNSQGNSYIESVLLKIINVSATSKSLLLLALDVIAFSRGCNTAGFPGFHLRCIPTYGRSPQLEWLGEGFIEVPWSLRDLVVDRWPWQPDLCAKLAQAQDLHWLIDTYCVHLGSFRWAMPSL